MPFQPNIAIAVLAGAAILGGAAYVERDKLGLSFGGGIHSVDFRNGPVEVVGTACADPQLTTAGVTKVHLHDGTYQLGQYQFELVGDVRYGDVSGHTGENNTDKAVFVGSCSANGKTSQVLFVYGVVDGNPDRLAFTDLSATGNTLVQSYSVGDGAIQVKANQGDPPTLVTLNYALLNGNLVSLNQAASPTVMPIPSAMPQNGMQTVENEPSQGTTTGAQEDKVDFETFHDQLAPYGNWTQHPRWGLVWHPTQVGADFRPFRDGHWEDTEEYGTVWVSDYKWGDIPFHYGRWGYDPSYGWVWQPGYTWSPGWVVWRQGGGNIGWFPMPPGYWDGTTEYVDDWNGWYGYRDLYGAAFDAAAFYSLWSFVPADDIFAPSIAVDVLAPTITIGFIGRTAGWTRFGRVRGHLFNHAIDRDRFRIAFGHPRPVGVRHDFIAHHGPITSVARGRAIETHERANGHVAGAGLAAHGPSSHFGGEFPRAAVGHSHGAAGHEFGSTHAFAHSGMTYSGFGASRGHGTTRSGFDASHHEFGASHSGFGQRTEGTSFGGAQRSEFGGAQRSGFAGSGSRTGFGGEATRTGIGGGATHSGFGGGATRSGFGGGTYQQRPAFAGGNMQQPASGGTMQRPAFGGGGMPSRPVSNGGGISRPAPQRPSNTRH